MVKNVYLPDNPNHDHLIMDIFAINDLSNFNGTKIKIIKI